VTEELAVDFLHAAVQSLDHVDHVLLLLTADQSWAPQPVVQAAQAEAEELAVDFVLAVALPGDPGWILND